MNGHLGAERLTVDEARLLPRFRRFQQQREDAQKVAATILETGSHVDSSTTTAQRSTAAGDPRRLRGIPAIGYSVAGVSPGTDPVSELMRKQPRT